MMQQWMAAKSEHPDALLFFRMGDFYELFGDDAVEAARVLELTLTSREKGKANAMPMAGVPHHAIQGYLTRLRDLGYRVAVCDQIEDPKKAKGLVKRAVTRVVTPGVVVDDCALAPERNNYLCAVWPGLEGYGVSYVDITTGEFRATLASHHSALTSELGRIDPSEVLVPPECEETVLTAIKKVGGCVTEVAVGAFNHRHRLVQRRSVKSDDIRKAVGAIGTYLDRTRPKGDVVIGSLIPYTIDEHVVIEETTFRNLEIVETLIGKRRQGSLLGLMDRTCTAMGARQLRRWLSRPLRDMAAIEERLEAVDELKGDAFARDELRTLLGKVYDLERLGGRVIAGVASPKDLANLRQSLEQLSILLATMKGLKAPQLVDLANNLDSLDDLHAQLTKVLAEEPAQSAADGRLIRDGFDPSVDAVVNLSRDGKNWILAYEAEQRETSKIGSLKVRYNKVFGYYVEVTRSNLHLVPENYIRKQTIANGERYFTVELKEYESKVLTAEERRITLETGLFETLRAELAEHGARILRTAGRLADIDVLSALAETAHRFDYVRPTLTLSPRMTLKGSRHPVVEQTIGAGEFVPNDIELDSETAQLLLITGPNMAGKSTVMRQVALTTLMAQIGSFVPASEAEIGLVDQIFTRVGATDDLSRGQSTFMVEMSETAYILRNATAQSLIILDEIGRGTSTFDGVSIAWAVAEYIHDHIGARTLFATHYHELTELVRTHDKVRNAHVTVREWNDNIVFLRTLQDGGTNRSYGVQVGRLAGLPEPVLARARELLAELEQADVAPDKSSPSRHQPNVAQEQFTLFNKSQDPPQDSVIERAVTRVDLNRTTPIEALKLIESWQKKLRS
jgi:DNA mismatch repair protein MutS